MIFVLQYRPRIEHAPWFPFVFYHGEHYRQQAEADLAWWQAEAPQDEWRLLESPD